MIENRTALPSDKNPQKRMGKNATGTIPPGSENSGGSYTSGEKLTLNRVIEVIALIGGLLALIAFLVGIIITQNNLGNKIETLTTDLNNYKNDNVIIKTQIENWFSRIEIRLENIRDKLNP